MFEYVISWYDDFTEKDVETGGFVSAPNYQEATTKLTNYYGEDNIYKLTLYYVRDDELLEVDDEIRQKIKIDNATI